MFKRLPRDRFRHLAGLVVSLVLLTTPGSRPTVQAAGTPYGLQYRANVVADAQLSSATVDGGMLAAPTDSRKFHPGDFAVVFTPCTAIAVQPANCLNQTITEIPTQVFIGSVESSGTLSWFPALDPPPGNPSRIETRLYWPGGAAADADGRFYVADSANSRVAVFDPAGAPLFTLGSYGQVYTVLDYPDADGDCYDVFFNTIDPSECPNDPTQLLGRFSWPADIAVAPNGETIVVADSFNHRIQFFRRDDSAPIGAPTTVVASNGWRFVASALGGFGKSEVNAPASIGAFSYPTGVDWAPGINNGRLAIADLDNGRVVVLDVAPGGPVQESNGTTFTGFSFGDSGQHPLNYPTDVKLGGDGRIVVADTQNNQVQVFDSAGASLAILGETGSDPGQFKYVTGVDVYPNGDILVSDADNGRLQVMARTPAGYAVADTEFASLSSPNGVAIAPNQRVAVVEFTGHDFASLGPLGLTVTTVVAPDPAQIAAGDQTAISFVGTNSGTTPLHNVVPKLYGATQVACAPGSYPGDTGPADVAAGGTHTFTVCATGSIPDSTITAQVAAQGTWSGFVYESPRVGVAPFSVRGLDHPALLVGGSAPAETAIDSTFTITVTVTNTGNVPLTDVAMDIAGNNRATRQPGGVSTAPTIAVGQSRTLTAPFTAVAVGAFDATVAVTAAEIDTSTGNPLTGTGTVHVTIRADTQPPQFLSFAIRGPNGQPPNANGWVQDPLGLGATVTATVADQGTAGLAMIRYAVIGQGGDSIFPPAGTASWTLTTAPIHTNGQGRLVAFWADDTAGNGHALGLYPGSTAGTTDTSPGALRAFCLAVPQQCVLVAIDTQAPLLDQDRIAIAPDRSEGRVFFTVTDNESGVASIALTPNVPENAGARIEMEPGSTSRGALVLTTAGADVWGRIAVTDRAGFVSEFTLPFRGDTAPRLRLDKVPPEAFNKLDPHALGATCTKFEGGVPLFSYWCTNKIFGTDNLPGLSSAAFAPVSVTPTNWNGNDNDVDDGDGDETNGNAELQTTTFTDEYTPASGVVPVQNPNRITLVEKVRQFGKQALVRVISYRYNDGPTITPDWAYQKVNWTNTNSGAVRTLTQTFEIGKGRDRVKVIATYDAKTDTTSIREMEPGPDLRIDAPGLVLLRMTTSSGTLKVQYDVNSGIRNPDLAPPELSVPHPITVEALTASGTPVSFTVTAVDDVDDGVSAVCAPLSGSVFPLGTTTTTCMATDAAGNTAAETFSVTVRDTTNPILSLPAPPTVAATGASGAVVTYLASATDSVDPAVSAICTPASSATFSIGTTTVSCSATDASGNRVSGSFKVTVADQTPPVLNLPADISATAAQPGGLAVAYVATAIDAVSGNRSVTCTPASGNVFSVGTTTVSCSSTDAAGNQATGTFKVIVTFVDTTPPILFLPGTITKQASSSNGIAVTFTATAMDTVSGPRPVICTPASGATFPIGTRVVTCSASDTSGNMAVGSFSVVVTNGPPDTTAPVLTVPETLTLEASSPTGRVVSFATSATDTVDGSVAVTCTPTAGSTFPIGSTTVTCRARDAANNTGTKTFTVVVRAAATNLAVVRTSIDVNGNSVLDGSAAVVSSGHVTLNSGSISGDLKVPGTPQLRLNGSPTFGGYVDGTGSQGASGYVVTLNSGTSLGHLVRYTDTVTLGTVAAPPTPAGSATVTANSRSGLPTSFSTVRNLTLNNNIGDVVVPPGAYGQFTANNSNAFVLGIEGATTPFVYSFSSLTLNGSSSLKVVGPVIITIGSGLTTSANIGSSLHPEWTQLRIAGGGLTLNGGSTYATVDAPSGTITLNSGSRLTGGIVANAVTLNSGVLAVRPHP